MMIMDRFEEMRKEMQEVCEQNILRFWIKEMTDTEHGGYYGRMDGRGKIVADAEKGAVLNARILWTFSAAYRVFRKSEYLRAAKRAMNYIQKCFIDHRNGGVYWSVTSPGHPLDTKKQTYAIGFMIYGFSEFYRATGDEKALTTALQLFYAIEFNAYDKVNNGYVEALTKDWQPIGDMRLSDKDENGSRTMNTHLHILEPYTNLYRCLKGSDKEQMLRERIKNLIQIFTQKLLNPKTFHLDLFFNDQWEGKRNVQSFGHDIEAVWLLHEAALEIGEPDLLQEIEALVPKIAKAADEGLQDDGSMIYERWTDTGDTDRERQWWVMCECIIGHVDLWQYFHDGHALEVALRCWEYIKKYLIDYQYGEWHWGVREDGSLNLNEDKAGFWKCPYHNTRLCLEVLERFRNFKS